MSPYMRVTAHHKRNHTSRSFAKHQVFLVGCRFGNSKAYQLSTRLKIFKSTGVNVRKEY